MVTLFFVVSLISSSSDINALSSGARLLRAPLRVEKPLEVGEWYAKNFGVATKEVESTVEVQFSCDFCLELTSSEAIKAYDASAPGLLEVGLQLGSETAVFKACEGSEIEPEDFIVCASLIPDENPEKETTMTVAYLEDPSGLRVAAIADETPQPGIFPAPKIVLCVSDLDASIKFYEEVLGMRLLRKRAQLPMIAALSAFFAFSDRDPESLKASAEGVDDKATPRIELRYLYGNDDVFPDRGLGDIQIADPRDPHLIIDAATKHAKENDQEDPKCETLQDGSVRLCDPDGYAYHILSASETKR